MAKTGWLIACLLTGMGCLTPLWAQTAEDATLSAEASAARQRAAAESFFETMGRSQNPYIAQRGRENLAKLRTQASDKRITVSAPVITQTAMGVAVTSILNKRVVGAFLVDTGATYTVLTPRMARQLGVVVADNAPRVSIHTANGVVSAPRVLIESLSLGGIEVRNVEAVVHPLGDDLLLAGLLGMNIFRHMEVTMGRNALTLTAEPVVDATADALSLNDAATGG